MKQKVAEFKFKNQNSPKRAEKLRDYSESEIYQSIEEEAKNVEKEENKMHGKTLKQK